MSMRTFWRGGSTGLIALFSLASIAWLGGAEWSAPASVEGPGYQIISGRSYLDHIKVLAGEKLKGRGNGTPELDRAAAYIAREFRKAGLSPGGDDGGFFQKFKITAGTRLGPGNRCRIEVSGRAPWELKFKESYALLGFSEQNQLAASVVFAGYGITAPEFQYDDYQGLDVSDKIVLVLDHEPQEGVESSRFDGKNNTHHAGLMSKVVNAKNHGARALLLVKDVLNHAEESAAEWAPRPTDAMTEDMGIVVLQMQSAAIDALLAIYKTSLRELQQAIDAALAPKSLPLEGSRVSIQVDAQRVRREVRNVVGYLRANGTVHAEEFIVLGAHYDHLGLGGQTSLAPDGIGKIHYGADDNASGTAGLLTLALALARDRMLLKRSVVFLAFAAEEVGLKGSAHYTKNPKFPLEKTIAMINLDMIGRPRNDKIKIGGVGTAVVFPELVKWAGGRVGLTAETSQSGSGASDHTSFNVKDIPVLFIFSGLHSDYHKPSDVWSKIDVPASEKVLRMVYLMERALDLAEPRPPYTKVKDDPPPPAGGGRGGYGPYFGSIPDMTDEVQGVRFADIRENSPAAKAGLRRGDVMIEFDGRKISNLQEYSYALRSKKPGDEVEVVVQRNGQSVRAQVKLEVRK